MAAGRDYTLKGINVFDCNNKLVATLHKTGSFIASDGCPGRHDSKTGKVYMLGMCIGKAKLVKEKKGK